jgi:hypothetical protein
LGIDPLVGSNPSGKKDLEIFYGRHTLTYVCQVSYLLVRKSESVLVQSTQSDPTR